MPNMCSCVVFLFLSNWWLKEIIVSKQRKIVKRKRKTGYPKITKGSGFKYEFSSFAALANHFGVK